MTRFLDADVCVVGSGSAGAMCAGLLARAGHRVLLINEARESRPWLELLSPEATLLLAELGMPLEQLTSIGRPCRGILDSWLRDEPVFTDFELMHCSLGWIIDRASLANAIKTFAIDQGALFIETNKPVTAHFNSNYVEICGQQNGSLLRLRSDFVVDATGISGRLVSMKRLRFDRLVAISLELKKSLPQDDCMLLGSSSRGWWYVLSLGSNFGRAVFMSDGDLIPKSPSDSQSLLRREFEEAFGLELAEYSSEEPATLKRDARTACRERLVQGRWMPIGDAAYTLDPIAGAGLTRSLRMAQSSAEATTILLTTCSTAALEQVSLSNWNDFAMSLSGLHSFYSVASRNCKSIDRPFWSRRANALAYKSDLYRQS